MLHPAALAETLHLHRRTIITVVLLVTLLANAASLCILYSSMRPIAQGNATDFWATTCNVDLAKTSVFVFGPGSALARNGQFFYAIPNMHGQRLYVVPESQAMKSFPAVLAELEKRAAASNPDDYGAAGYLRWKSAPHSTQTPQYLCDLIADSLIDKIRKPPHTNYPFAGIYGIIDRLEFYRSLQKADFYWFNFVFELAFLSTLCFFMAWPLLCNRHIRYLFAAWAATPFLFYLPFWLGYAARTRSPWGPHGGILYPWLICYAGRPQSNFDWEVACLRAFPPVFSSISQDIGGSIGSLTGSSTPGPLYALVLSIALTSFLIMAILALHFLRTKNQSRPGFEVLPPNPK